jgi:excinuclease ABC subunit C
MPYYLSRTGEPLKVICHIRDEAHRFGITHHRNRRSKNFIKTGLEGIEGVGEKSVTALLRHFRTLSNISKASLDDIAKIVGQAKALKVVEHLQKEKANS